MKSWSVSRLAALLAALLLLLPAGEARAAAYERGMACLDVVDIACAEAVAKEADGSPRDQWFQGLLAFHLGQFTEAQRLLEAAAPKLTGDAAFAADLERVRATVRATEGFVRERRGDVEVQYLPGTDLILLDDLFTTLQAAHDRIGTRLGGAPPGTVRVEIYPTAPRFIEASGLGEQAVRTTGVVALSKWSRLLVTSPRALMRGYPWKDTVAHEYIHYIVAWRTKDRTPVWLQEGIARSHESLWRGDSFSSLPSYQQSLLADALAKDNLVTLQEMHPSMAYLPSADRAALAFAQVSTMVEWLEESAGAGSTRKVLDLVRDGADALQAVAKVANGGDSDAFMAGWKASLARLDLVGHKLAAPPVVLEGGADDLGIDPVLAQRADLAGFVHLGDLLLGAERPEAALIEYRKAIPPGEPPSPMLSVRIARAQRALGRLDDAAATLRASIADYAEYATTHKDLAVLLLARGETAAALVELSASADINPYDPEVQGDLAKLYAAAGDPERAARHRRYREILVLGGGPIGSSGGAAPQRGARP